MDSKNLQRFETSSKKHDCVAEGKLDIEVERLFWKTLKHSAPIYGADIEGSLFDEAVPWNLNRQKGLLNYGLNQGQRLAVPWRAALATRLRGIAGRRTQACSEAGIPTSATPNYGLTPVGMSCKAP